jgi:hypothetical protein
LDKFNKFIGSEATNALNKIRDDARQALKGAGNPFERDLVSKATREKEAKLGLGIGSQILAARSNILTKELSRKGFGGQLRGGDGVNTAAQGQSLALSSSRALAKASDTTQMEIREIADKQLEIQRKMLVELEKEAAKLKAAGIFVP